MALIQFCGYRICHRFSKRGNRFAQIKSPEYLCKQFLRIGSLYLEAGANRLNNTTEHNHAGKNCQDKKTWKRANVCVDYCGLLLFKLAQEC